MASNLRYAELHFRVLGNYELWVLMLLCSLKWRGFFKHSIHTYRSHRKEIRRFFFPVLSFVHWIQRQLEVQRY